MGREAPGSAMAFARAGLVQLAQGHSYQQGPLTRQRVFVWEPFTVSGEVSFSSPASRLLPPFQREGLGLYVLMSCAEVSWLIYWLEAGHPLRLLSHCVDHPLRPEQVHHLVLFWMSEGNVFKPLGSNNYRLEIFL
jgi:hypothetical protein